MSETQEAPEQPDRPQAVLQISKLEIIVTHGSGDINVVTVDNDAKGIVVGRKNRVKYNEPTAGTPFADLTSVRTALDRLAREVSESEMPWKEKIEILGALGWWQENIDTPDEPELAAENASTVESILPRVG